MQMPACECFGFLEIVINQENYNTTPPSTSATLSFHVEPSATSTSSIPADVNRLACNKRSLTEHAKGNVQAKKVAMPTLAGFVIHTSVAERNALNEQVARMIFATNFEFQLVEHFELKS